MSHPPVEGRLRASVSALRSRLELNSRDASLSPAELAEAVRLLTEILDQTEAGRQAAERRLQWCISDLSRVEERLVRVENSLFFRSMRAIGGGFRSAKLRLGQTLLHTPLHSAYLRLKPGVGRDSVYEQWLAREETETPSWQWHRDRALQWTYRPLISVVMATHNPKREWLEAAVESVVAQSYPCWELCVCDDASEAWVAEYLAQKSAGDSRIRYCLSPESLGIARALNRAGELARGEYAAFLDHDDVLSALALHYIADALQADAPQGGAPGAGHPDANRPDANRPDAGQVDAIYSDEDYLDPGGRRIRPSFKPDWSPDLLSSCMYWGHFLVVARRRLDEIGWFRGAYDGAQDYDVALRLTDRPSVIRHVPRILYHWRQHPQSTAASASAKRYTHEAGRRALEDAIRRRNCSAEAADGPIPNSYYLRRKIPPGLRVSIIICSRSAKLLRRCLQALEETRGRFQVEVVVVHHQTGDDARMEEILRRYKCTVVPFGGPFNFSRMNNLGAEAAHGEALLFLNDDVVPQGAEWLEHLAAHIQRPEVGVVGAKLVYPSGAVQHAGIVVGMPGGAGHPGRGVFRSDLWRWLDYTRNVSAVTGACMGLRPEVFAGLGGFDLAFPVNYNDVDLCLRARRAGYQVIYEPHAVLRHDESQTRTSGTRVEERERFFERWAEELERPDPYFSPMLDIGTEEIRLR